MTFHFWHYLRSIFLTQTHKSCNNIANNRDVDGKHAQTWKTPEDSTVSRDLKSGNIYMFYLMGPCGTHIFAEMACKMSQSFRCGFVARFVTGFSTTATDQIFTRSLPYLAMNAQVLRMLVSHQKCHWLRVTQSRVVTSLPTTLVTQSMVSHSDINVYTVNHFRFYIY